MTNKDLIELFLDALWVENGLSENTLSAYGSDLRIFSKWLKGKSLMDVDHGDALELVELAEVGDLRGRVARPRQWSVGGVSMRHTRKRGSCHARLRTRRRGVGRAPFATRRASCA